MTDRFRVENGGLPITKISDNQWRALLDEEATEQSFSMPHRLYYAEQTRLSEYESREFYIAINKALEAGDIFAG